MPVAVKGASIGALGTAASRLDERGGLTGETARGLVAQVREAVVLWTRRLRMAGA